MKILIVGGGPGGLYAGLLLKKALPAADIHLVERNPASATYGWGVVFSDRTLRSFREADPESYAQITDHFVLWHAIDTYIEDRRIRCSGHGFAGLARQVMLNILQDRCRELRVAMDFETEIDDPAQLEGFDLVIAADGINSRLREWHAEEFQPRLSDGNAKYIWLGTDKVLDSFTFIFRRNDHGLFQAHAYPFDGQTSTFIVECEEAVWRAAGLDQADEAQSIDYCQLLFADFLGEHTLLSNQSRWLNFVTVTNKTWHHKNLVLLGDAAHTAHFSIGSGTKMAMEDAIALAAAISQTTDLESALNHYEMERRPRVELLQQAASESQAYFENIKRYIELDPLQFTFHLLTRSGRIDYDNLRLRDPDYLQGVDRWFAGSLARPSDRSPLMVAPPPMFNPLRLREIGLENRVVVSTTPTDSSNEGWPGADLRDQLASLAGSGAGLVLAGPVAISAEGRITPGCPGLYDEGQQEVWRELVELVHAGSQTKIGVQLNHSGRRGSTRPRQAGLDRPLRDGNWPLQAASALPYTPNNQIPVEIDRDGMDRVIADFVRATALAEAAGFDLLELHCGHGYLLAGFLSPLSNQRTDEYGGSLANRQRYPLEVFAAVREVWPAGKPISVALTAHDWASGGAEPGEAVDTARRLKELGCDLVHVLAGQTTADGQPDYGPGSLTRLSDQIRHDGGIQTMVGGYLTRSGEINSILAAGHADLCIMSPR